MYGDVPHSKKNRAGESESGKSLLSNYTYSQKYLSLMGKCPLSKDNG